FQEYFQSDQFFKNDFAVAGVISAILYASLNYIKAFFNFIWRRIARAIIYEVTIEQSDELYTLVAKMISDRYPHKLRRVEAFLSERHGENYYANGYNKSDEVKLRHYTDFIVIRKGLTFIKVSKEREKLENADSFLSAFMGRISLSGFFAKKQIDALLKEALTYIIRDTKDTIKRYTFEDGYWSSDMVFTNKTVATIFFPEKEEILERVDLFTQSKDLYLSRGVEWYLGLLLYGKPGSGKTSFGKALAKHTKRDLYTLSLGGMTDNEFKSAFHTISANALLLLDDIDICISNRDDKDKLGVKLNTLLSCLDGTDSRSDLIVVMTTNRIAALDEALIRKGRVDLTKEVSYPNRTSIQQYIANFYDLQHVPPITIRHFNFSMVEIQDICLRHANAIEAVKAINNL
ncbi:MAG: AAA family ATPase, partial [Bacteroidota bacterium]